ncbi:restriction endonuclease subunit M [Serratia sp. S1B]|nr:restriction endonuclease subunit M [Serratia sp. S1B]
MSELVLENEFFAPASSDLIDGLLGQYRQLRSDVEMMAGMINTHHASVYHFLEGNRGQDRYVRSVSELFKLEGAIASLNSTFWQKALNMTDVYEYMPNNRREEWNEQINNPQGIRARNGTQQKEWIVEPLPDFEEEAVRPTIMSLLNSRSQFFSERVDGIFRALSGEHVTNRPEGFGKRMIIARVYNEWGNTDYRTAGYIQDLRIVIAKFMGRDEPRWNATDSALLAARRRHGEWLTLDGGALRVRGYLKGTAHLEVHPEMAWRLNCILAQLYPMAIPPQFRQKPKRKLKDFVLMNKPLPFAVLGEFAKMKAERHEPWIRERWEKPQQPLTTNPFNRAFGYGDYDKAVREQAERVLETIGGVKVLAGPHKNIVIWEFDYDPSSALDEVIASGCIPDHKSHQFYPTSESLAKRCVQLADIGPSDSCLEPSAGMGGIADYLPQERTTCIEISPMHCKILEAKGFTAVQGDFIKWAANSIQAFDRIVMNPPFSEGRAVAHVQAAAECLKPGGRLVAIMPAGNKGKDILPGWNVDWSETISNEFSGTGVSVVILTAEREV